MCNKVREFVQCRRCPRIKNDGPEPGYYYSKVGNYSFIQECECHKRWREETLMEVKFSEAKVSTDYTFDCYRGIKSLRDLECLKRVAENPEKFKNQKMIYVWGPNGCQKTSMVKVLGKELIKKGYSVQYTLMSDLITGLVSDFSMNEDAKEKKEYFIQKCMDCDFLIIDEAFDAKKAYLYVSGYQVPYLDTFIRNRFEINGKSIIFVSNIYPNQIAEVPASKPGEPARQGFGTSLQNLIERNTKQSLLEFKDVWVENANQFDRYSMFER